MAMPTRDDLAVVCEFLVREMKGADDEYEKALRRNNLADAAYQAVVGYHVALRLSTIEDLINRKICETSFEDVQVRQERMDDAFDMLTASRE